MLNLGVHEQYRPIYSLLARYANSNASKLSDPSYCNYKLGAFLTTLENSFLTPDCA